jgi:hypothetical protein
VLARAAQKAVEGWRYDPALVDSKASPVLLTVTVNFKLATPPRFEGVMKGIRHKDPDIRTAAAGWLGRFRPV